MEDENTKSLYILDWSGYRDLTYMWDLPLSFHRYGLYHLVVRGLLRLSVYVLLPPDDLDWYHLVWLVQGFQLWIRVKFRRLGMLRIHPKG